MGLNSNYEKYDSNGEFLYQIIIDGNKDSKEHPLNLK